MSGYRIIWVALLAGALLLGCEREPATPIGELHVSSTPGAAELVVNGQPYGGTPEATGEHLVLRLAPGTHRLEARKPIGPLQEWFGEVEVEIPVNAPVAPIRLALQPRLTAAGEAEQAAYAARLAERERILAERFAIGDDGTVTDSSTGLQWMRCSIGQEWDGQSCLGEVRLFSWTSAQTIPDEFTYADREDWRLPVQMELFGLTFCSSARRFAVDDSGGGGGCADEFRRPTILEAVFPNTPKINYWSSTQHETYNYAAMGVSFNTGVTGAGGRADLAALRLVREAR